MFRNVFFQKPTIAKVTFLLVFLLKMVRQIGAFFQTVGAKSRAVRQAHVPVSIRAQNVFGVTALHRALKCGIYSFWFPMVFAHVTSESFLRVKQLVWNTVGALPNFLQNVCYQVMSVQPVKKE
jgi:hypothetical protein